MMHYRNLDAFNRRRNALNQLKKAGHVVASEASCLATAKTVGVHDSYNRREGNYKISNIKRNKTVIYSSISKISNFTKEIVHSYDVAVRIDGDIVDYVSFQRNITNVHFNTSSTKKNLPRYLIGLVAEKEQLKFIHLHKMTVSHPQEFLEERKKFEINSAVEIESISILAKIKNGVQTENNNRWQLFKKSKEIYGASQIKRQFSTSGNSSNNGNDSTKGLLRLFLFQIHPDYFLQVRTYSTKLCC